MFYYTVSRSNSTYNVTGKAPPPAPTTREKGRKWQTDRLAWLLQGSRIRLVLGCGITQPRTNLIREPCKRDPENVKSVRSCGVGAARWHFSVSEVDSFLKWVVRLNDSLPFLSEGNNDIVLSDHDSGSGQSEGRARE